MAVEPRHFCNALDGRHELAREIGLLMADYAALELSLFNIFAMLSRLRPEEVFPKFFSQRTINRKTELLEAEMWRLDEDLQPVLKKLIKRMKGAATRRTEIAHAFPMQGAKGPMRLLMYGNEARLALLDRRFTDRTLHQFHTLASDLLTFEAILHGLAPDILRPKIEAVFAPINAQLQRPPRPPAPPTQRVRQMTTASLRRLGLTDALKKGVGVNLSVEEPSWLPRGISS